MRPSVLAVAVAVLLAVPALATAQPGMTPVQPPGAAEPTLPDGDTKSEGVALALSLGGTVASYGLIYWAGEHFDDDNYGGLVMAGSLGATFAPSFGHWYAGKFWTRGLGLRAAASGTALVAAMWALSECPILASEDECNETDGPAVLMVGAIGLWVYGTIDDIVTAPGRVRAYNKEHAGIVAITPMLRRDGGGLALTGRF